MEALEMVRMAEFAELRFANFPADSSNVFSLPGHSRRGVISCSWMSPLQEWTPPQNGRSLMSSAERKIW